MEITHVRMQLMHPMGHANRLRAFFHIEFDRCFVVRDVKLLEGGKGFFLAMPARPLCDRCPACGRRTPYFYDFCGGCGEELPENEPPQDRYGKDKLETDLCHPISNTFRQTLLDALVRAYKRELERPGSCTPLAESRPVPRKTNGFVKEVIR